MDDVDQQVVAAVCAGDTGRYAELVDRYQQPALRLAYGLLGNAQDAEEAAQDAFVSAYQALRGFRGGAKFSTWFYRIVVNKCRDAQRSRARRIAPLAIAPGDDDQDSVFDFLEDPAAGPGELAQRGDVARALSAAIRALPHQQREAIVLHHLHGFSVDDAAAAMGCRAGTVKSHLFRAHGALRARLHPLLRPEDVS
ncbi:MAG: sigma-70 family RNA polymerase sigma factor [Dehalococcoidia bacterium]|nr:sigma-70 family RNA polymerase sigma factor [Dehalococcoidia bacterium]